MRNSLSAEVTDNPLNSTLRTPFSIGQAIWLGIVTSYAFDFMTVVANEWPFLPIETTPFRS